MSESTGDARRLRFEALYEDYLQPITGYVRRRLRAHAIETDDVVAEIFFVAWRRLEDVPSAPDDRLWLYGVARHTTAQAFRTRRRRCRLADRVAQVSEAPTWPAEDAKYDEVRAVVAGLGSREREVVELYYWEGLTQREIAAVLGCSENAVALRLRRAKERVRRALATSPPPLRRRSVISTAGMALEVERNVP